MSLNGFSLNPDALEFSVPNSISSSWNLTANEFIPFEPSPSVKEPEAKELPIPKIRTYTLAVLRSLKESNKHLPEGVFIPVFYSKASDYSHKKSEAFSSNNAKPMKRSQITKDQPIKRAESIFNSSSILVKTEKPFVEKMKKEADELEKKSREIRCILNKLSQSNFDKLSRDLVTNFVYNDQLLSNLANFLFERATALSFPELYAKLCRRLRNEFKAINLSTRFRKAIVEKCRESFYNEDEPLEKDKLMEAEFKRKRRLIGNIKFIALLLTENMIKAEIMYECFDVLLEPKSLSEETLETCVTLFKDTCPYLVVLSTSNVLEYYDRIVSFRDNSNFSKRLSFMIQDLIDLKDELMIPKPLAHLIASQKSPSKNPPKTEEAPVEEEKNTIEDEVKKKAKKLMRIYSKEGFEEIKVDLDELVRKNLKFTTEIIIQILKYGLYEYKVNEEILLVWNLAMLIVTNYKLDAQIIQNALVSIENDLEEIKTDSPKSAGMFEYLKTLHISA